MIKKDFCILFGSAECHQHYDLQKLSLEDQKRLETTPNLADRLDWQSSRYLKQQLLNQYSSLSLSHKKAYATLIATVLPNISLGIDLEYRQNRDFMALAPLCLTASEQQWLLQQASLELAFYQLWTLKECLIKVHRGQLMDMNQWSLIQPDQNYIQLPSTKIPLQAYTAVLDSSWIISVMYPQWLAPLEPLHCHGFGRWQQLNPIWHRWPSLHNA